MQLAKTLQAASKMLFDLTQPDTDRYQQIQKYTEMVLYRDVSDLPIE